jgi:hypothetical protein
LFIASASCAAGALAPPDPTAAEWQAARVRLEALRDSQPDQPYGIVVRVTLREPRSGRSFVARGALAVDPRRAMRMILLGPGGTTALDAWVTPDAYRFEVPPIGLLDRGGEHANPSLPVDFFRWWFLAPVDGRLLASYAGPSLSLSRVAECRGRWFILRRGASTVTLCDGPEEGRAFEIFGTERTGAKDERLSFRGEGLVPHAGDTARYEDVRSGVRAEVDVESRDADMPDPVAFLDPDHGGAR